MSKEVTVYRTAWCPFCARAEALLSRKPQAKVNIIDVDEQPDQRAIMVEKAGRTSVPQIFIAGEHVGGCDDLMALEHAGKLDQLLAG